jgi:putative phage-type endonuclease
VADLIPTSTEAEWLEARRRGVTASEIAIAMGLSPYSSPYALYHQKLGILPPQDDSDMMERGRVLEPFIADKWAQANPRWTALGTGRELYRHDSRPWMLATPDRLVHRLAHHDGKVNGTYVLPEAVLECKVDGGSDQWGEEGTDEVPVHYRCQVIWQMDVMGVSRAHVACLDPARWKVREYLVGHAEGCETPMGYVTDRAPYCAACADLLVMLDAAGEFRRRLEVGDAPDVDWRPATADALKKLHPSLEDRDAVIGRQLEISYQAAVKRFKEAERRKDEMANRLREAMGGARRAVAARRHPDGERAVIATRQVYDVKESVRKPYTVDKIVAAPTKTKKES